MTHIIRTRLALVALAAFAALVVIASPASATDDPAPRTPPAGAPAPAPAPAPTTTTTTTRTAAGKVTIRLRYTKSKAGRCGGIRISASGAGVSGLKRVDIQAGKRRVGRDRTRPYRVVIKGSRLKSSKKVKIKLVGPSSTKTVTRSLRSCSKGTAAQSSAFESIPVAMAIDALLGRVVAV
jgi:hypothetical protein